MKQSNIGSIISFPDIIKSFICFLCNIHHTGFPILYIWLNRDFIFSGMFSWSIRMIIGFSITITIKQVCAIRDCLSCCWSTVPFHIISGILALGTARISQSIYSYTICIINIITIFEFQHTCSQPYRRRVSESQQKVHFILSFV